MAGDHPLMTAKVSCKDYGSATGETKQLRLFNHNVFGFRTPVSTATLKQFRIPISFKSIQDRLDAVGAKYPGLIEADETRSLERLRCSGAMHCELFARFEDDALKLGFLQECPPPYEQNGEYTKEFLAFTSVMNDADRKKFAESFVNFDNTGKHGGNVMCAPGVTAVPCRDVEALGLSEDQRLQFDALFKAIESTKYDELKEVIPRACLYKITEGESTYFVVNMHTDFGKVDETIAVIQAARALGIPCVGDTNIQTLEDAKVDTQSHGAKLKQLADLNTERDRIAKLPEEDPTALADVNQKITKLNSEIARERSLLAAHDVLKDRECYAAGNTYDLITAPYGEIMCYPYVGFGEKGDPPRFTRNALDIPVAVDSAKAEAVQLSSVGMFGQRQPVAGGGAAAADAPVTPPPKPGDGL